ncbi:Hsp20/alpha crystallin family protein [Pseudactinotalea sp. Z1732]|uniref:Hsp20/alpha crystallin family protein n=1 Tax=Micrococcales TaxID=85006 RepID=UPI003C7E2043
MSTLSLWSRRNPAAEFDALVRNAFGTHALATTGYTPAAEVVREGEDALVRLELPGVNIDSDVTVEVTDGRLVIRGERHATKESAENATVREIRYGSFERTFRLPGSVGADQISADYDAGILTVRVAGAYAGATPRQIAINTGAPARAGGEQAE